MSLNPLAIEVVKTFKDRLLDRWPDRILEVRVFGSVARAEAREDSDLDVFVLVDERDDAIWHGILEVAHDVSSHSDLSWWLAPFVKSKAQFADLQRRERMIARDILTEGIPV